MSDSERGGGEASREKIRDLAGSLNGAFAENDEFVSHLETVLRDALSTDRVIDDLAELFHTERSAVAARLAEMGLGAVVSAASEARGDGSEGWCASPVGSFSVHGIEISAAGPGFDEAFSLSAEDGSRLDTEWARLVGKVREPDPFLGYYREGVEGYAAAYRRDVQPQLSAFVAERFSGGGPAHLVTIGIGANEQFWHYVQRWWMREGGSPAWHVCDNPKDLADLPAECSVENTLFMEFSRSGKTQEVVKIHEFLPREAVRVVFANAGPLFELGQRDGATSLLLPMSDSVPGRFGKNLTPMLIAPLDVLGIDFDGYWARIAECVSAWDVADPASPPAAIARYIRAAQLAGGVNHIYFGSNDGLLLCSADELVQFWNEGVNKGANDITLSRYFGLPRDSHLNIEAVLANAATKMGIFLLRKGGRDRFQHSLISDPIHALKEEHRGLSVADVDYALGKANAQHFASKMPAITIELDDPDLLDSATLSQLWTDVVYCYSLMVSVNPGSNPEVKLVRDRADALLTEFSRSS